MRLCNINIQRIKNPNNILVRDNISLTTENGVDIVYRINLNGWKAFKDDMIVKWWHCAYKIPRLW